MLLSDIVRDPRRKMITILSSLLYSCFMCQIVNILAYLL